MTAAQLIRDHLARELSRICDRPIGCRPMICKEYESNSAPVMDINEIIEFFPESDADNLLENSYAPRPTLLRMHMPRLGENLEEYVREVAAQIGEPERS